MLVHGVTIGPNGQYTWDQAEVSVNALPVLSRLRSLPEERIRGAFDIWTKVYDETHQRDVWVSRYSNELAFPAPVWQTVMVEYIP